MNGQSTKRFSKKYMRAQARRIYRSLYFPPLVIFIATLFLTYWTYQANHQAAAKDSQSIITNRATTTEDTISEQLKTYQRLLYGGVGLAQVYSPMTEKTWHAYINAFDLENNYKGIRTLGFAKTVPRSETNNLIQFMQGQGISDFKITTTGTSDPLNVVLYEEPNNAGIGLNMSDVPSRYKAMSEARDKNTAVITEPGASIDPKHKTDLIVMYMPVYKPGQPIDDITERRSALDGYVFAGIQIDDFLAGLSHTSVNGDSPSFRIYMDGDQNAYYQSQDYDKRLTSKNVVAQDSEFDLFGKTWHMKFLYNKSGLTAPGQRAIQAWTWFGGVIFAFLLAQLIYLLLKARARELMNQKERDVDTARDQLLSLASHQLRTPATTVKQYLGMVLQGFSGRITKSQRLLLEKAYKGNERQLYTINEMLHVAKVNDGRITLARNDVDMKALVRNVVSDQQAAIDDAGHKIVVKLPKKSLTMYVDEHMLTMALDNLLTNAIKYSPEAARISVRLYTGDNNRFVYIDVTDSGVGISKADLTKLFKLFSRLNNDRTQRVSGTGVGLYLAKHLVELHRGSIGVVSAPGEGSTFTIKLPKRYRGKK
ncbi:MAG: CHASE domain-containing protein [Candidatus Saccharimonadales bacterium]